MPEFKSVGSPHLADKLRNIARTLRLVWSACRGWTVLWVILLMVQGVLPVATVQVTRLLVDGSLGRWPRARPRQISGRSWFWQP